MSEYIKKADELLNLLEKENEQLELDFKEKKCGPDEYWCKKDKKCKKKDHGGSDERDHPLSEDVDWAELDELTDKLRMLLASCGEHKISSAGGHRLNINGIIVRVEGKASDMPGIGGITKVN